MSYTALYRKWRPDSFDDVKGQDHIVTALKNQIRSGRIGHAYLFCGTRGTGKTTVAKIFARAVNCEHPRDGSPCNECARCRAIQAGAAVNVVEIDAASNNGVDNIREIRDEVRYSPADGKYRVYIIDEVHMLSTGAFNALLKTLEEPPSYVIFILATTEVHKIPVTVLSRCQRYDFRRISNETIEGRLRQLTDGEQVPCEDKALAYIAKKADGSMRDAISILDQCMAFYYGEPLTYEKTLDVLGAVDHTLFQKLTDAVLRRDISACIYMIDEIVAQGRELGQLVTDLIWYLRNLMLLKASDLDADTLEMPPEEIEELAGLAVRTDTPSIMRYIRAFSDLSSQMRYAADKRVLLEMAVIRLCTPSLDQSWEGLLARLEALEKLVQTGEGVIAADSRTRREEGGSLSGEKEQSDSGRQGEDGKGASDSREQSVVHVAADQKKVLDMLTEAWPEITASLKAAAKAALKNTYIKMTGDGCVDIVFGRPEDFLVGNRPAVMELVGQTVQNRFGIRPVFRGRLENPGETRDSTHYVTDEEVQSVFNIEIISE